MNPCAGRVGACAALVACLGWARAARSAEPRPEAPARHAPPLCRVELATRGGQRSAFLLLAYEEATFSLRRADGSELRVREADVASIAFFPLYEKPRPDETAPPRPLPPDGEDVVDEDLPAFLRLPREMREGAGEWLKRHSARLGQMKDDGKLRAHIARLEREIVEVNDVAVARQKVVELFVAYRVDGIRVGPEYWRTLVRRIKDQKVRRALQPHAPRRRWRP